METAKHNQAQNGHRQRASPDSGEIARAADTGPVFSCCECILIHASSAPNSLCSADRRDGPPGEGMNPFDQGSDIAGLENAASALTSSDNGVHHSMCQLVSSNHEIRERPAKRRVDGAQNAVGEIRFLAWLDWIDIGGAEKVNAREPGSDQCVLGLSFVSRESDPTFPVGSAPFPLKNEKAASGLAPCRTRANSMA
jgi:hypothetical protein